MTADFRIFAFAVFWQRTPIQWIKDHFYDVYFSLPTDRTCVWFPETKFVYVQLFTDHAINVVTRDMKSDSTGQF